MSLQHIQKNSPRLLPKPAKFEKNPPNGYRVIRKTKYGAGGAAGAGGARSSPIHKQASLAGRLITVDTQVCTDDVALTNRFLLFLFYFFKIFFLLLNSLYIFYFFIIFLNFFSNFFNFNFSFFIYFLFSFFLPQCLTYN